MEENAGLNWFLVAKRARELGGDPDRTQIDGFRQLLDNLELSKRRVVGIAEGYSQRVAQIGL